MNTVRQLNRLYRTHRHHVAGLRCLLSPHVPGWSVGRFDDHRCLHCRKELR